MSDVIDPRALHAARAKYAPHLDFDTKAAIYALFHHRGVSRKSLADAFGVHRLTVAHIVDDNPRHYATVKARAVALTVHGMYMTYVRPEHIAAINAALAGEPVERAPTPIAISRADPSERSHEGAHRLTARNRRGHIVVNLYVTIEWRGADSIRDPDDVPGWYWQKRGEIEWQGVADRHTNIERAGLTSREVYDFLADYVESKVDHA